MKVAVAVGVGLKVAVAVGVGVKVAVAVGVGEALINLRCAGMVPTIGFRSGPIGGHGRSPHHDGWPVKYRLLGIV